VWIMGKYQITINMDQGDSCMLYLRSFNRFILISLALLGLSVSTGASAKTFLVEFQTSQTPGFTPDPFWPITTPGTTLFDFTIEATPALGLVIDDPATLIIESDFGLPSSVSDLNLYDWGTFGQHGDVELVTPSFQSLITIFDDQPRDGNVDNAFGFFEYFAPDIGAPPGFPLTELYLLEFFNMTPVPGVDFMRVGRLRDPTLYLVQGDLIISDITAIPAVPVPAAVWLFGTALIGLVGFGKRRKAA
jgi:hypothetical protein